MPEFLLEHYQLIKALHVISVIAWMAGMFYLPRLFVYHCRVGAGSETSEIFKVMERKLLRIIINPAMTLSWIFGGLMIWANPDLFMAGWFHVKFMAIILMSALHGYLATCRRRFVHDKNTHSERFYRILNEVPTILTIIIVLMAIVEPF